MKKIIKELLELWNVYGGIAVASAIAWALNFEKIKMDKITSFILLLLAVCGLLTLVKTKVFHSKVKPIDKALMSTSSTTKVVDITIGKDDIVSEKKIKEKMKRTERKWKIMFKKIGNFFRWIWGNKVTLTTIIINLLVVGVANYVVFAEFLAQYEWFTTHQLAFQIAVPSASAIYTALSVYATVNKRGCESLKELEEISEQHKQEKLAQLTKEQKAVIKNAICETQELLAKAKEKKASFDKIISNFQVLSNIGGYVVPNEKKVEYNSAVSGYASLEAEIKHLENELTNLKNSLK